MTERRDEQSTAGESRPERRQASERLQAIREVAWHRFSREPYQAVTLAELATEAGLTRSVLIAHVGSKAALYEYCIERATAELVEHLEAAPAEGGGGLEEGLRAILDALLELVLAEAPCWRLVERHIYDRGAFAREGEQMRSTIVDCIHRKLFGGTPSPVEGTTSAVVLGSVWAVAGCDASRAAGGREVLLRALFATLWRGLAASAPGTQGPPPGEPPEPGSP